MLGQAEDGTVLDRSVFTPHEDYGHENTWEQTTQTLDQQRNAISTDGRSKQSSKVHFDHRLEFGVRGSTELEIEGILRNFTWSFVRLAHQGRQEIGHSMCRHPALPQNDDDFRCPSRHGWELYLGWSKSCTSSIWGAGLLSDDWLRCGRQNDFHKH